MQVQQMIIAFFFVLVLADEASAVTIGKYQRWARAAQPTRSLWSSRLTPTFTTQMPVASIAGTCFSGDSCGAGISFDVSGDPGTTIPINGACQRFKCAITKGSACRNGNCSDCSNVVAGDCLPSGANKNFNAYCPGPKTE